MAQFQYKAIQLDGSLAEGQLEAGGRQEAFRQMESRGLRPISLAERAAQAEKKAEASAPKKGFGFQSTKVTPRELENFTRLLSSLLAAGVPLSRALVILGKEASSPAAAAKWKEVYGSVVDGISLADAM
ncbi:MAG TPA: type II secretion system F family protein, partial [Verrucomicrobiae bacterium]|nr:type II secretion system F family protein [Verrucomicrobiae bacterium]